MKRGIITKHRILWGQIVKDIKTNSILGDAAEIKEESFIKHWYDEIDNDCWLCDYFNSSCNSCPFHGARGCDPLIDFADAVRFGGVKEALKYARELRDFNFKIKSQD